MMRESEVRKTADGIADTLASIEAGSLDATPEQRAHLGGALQALRGVLGEAPPVGIGPER